MLIKKLAIAAALAASASSFAAGSCTKSFNLGSMGPPATKSFFSGAFSAGNFDDCYDFSINAAANASGTTTEWNWDFTNLLGYIDVITASLYNTVSGVRTTLVGSDGTPEKFSFAGLSAGSYELVISGTTTRGALGTLVGYSGTLNTSAAVAAPVPEPELYAMLGLGFLAAGWAARRKAG